MSKKPQNQLEKALSIEFDPSKNDLWLTKQQTLRKLIGFLGVGLPIILLATLYIDTGQTVPMYSISHYYYTRAASIFVIIVSHLAIFLLVYKGEDRQDFYISALAGIFALCLLIFPTNNISEICNDKDNICSVTILRKSEFRKDFHYISAAIFLASLAYMSICLFTRPDNESKVGSKQKRRKNRVFRTCGVIMVLAILGILANFLGIISDETFTKYHLTFWLEAVAVWSFGISWLTKADVFLKNSVKEA